MSTRRLRREINKCTRCKRVMDRQGHKQLSGAICEQCAEDLNSPKNIRRHFERIAERDRKNAETNNGGRPSET